MQDQTYNRNSSDQGRNKKEKGNWKKRNNQGEGSNSSPKEQQNSGDNDRNAVHNKEGKKKFNRKPIQCYSWQKCGHFAKECKGKRVPRNLDEAQ